MSDAATQILFSGSANRTMTIGAPQPPAPPPVGCACGSFGMDPLGCVAEWHLPGVGGVVPVEAYQRMRAMYVRRSPRHRFLAWRDKRRLFRLRWWQRVKSTSYNRSA